MADEPCPECGRPALWRCRCRLADRECSRGHSWHTCPVHGVTVRGPADHRGEAARCRCEGASETQGET